MKKLLLSPQESTSTRAGFTLVELSIAMAAIAALLITVAIVTSNLVTIYQKGMTVKAVNSVGRNLVDEFISAINTAPSVDTTSLCTSLANFDSASIEQCKRDHAFDYIYHASQNAEGEQYNGVFCTGRYSYIWNTYYSESTEGHNLKLRYLDENTGEITLTDAPRLMKLEDRTYRVCSAVMDSSGKYESNFDSNMTIDITTLAHSSSTAANPIWNPIPTPEQGMLDEFDLDLTLYELTIFPISQDAVTLRTYMSGTFILATLRGNVDIMRSGDYCSTGGTTEDGEQDTGNIHNLGSEFNYCAINKFNFAARTAGV